MLLVGVCNWLLMFAIFCSLPLFFDEPFRIVGMDWASTEEAQSRVEREELANGRDVDMLDASSDAPEQHFHADGRERGIVNVFVPLVDVPASMGPTHFRRGSHAWDHDSPYLTREQRRAQEGAEDVVPELRRGSVLMYDYRVFHRGGANLTGKRRPVAYVMYARDGTEDTWNFPDESVWDPDSTGAG